jgi:hypothetical protein
MMKNTLTGQSNKKNVLKIVKNLKRHQSGGSALLNLKRRKMRFLRLRRVAQKKHQSGRNLQLKLKISLKCLKRQQNGESALLKKNYYLNRLHIKRSPALREWSPDTEIVLKWTSL